jgi:TP901 family phage tail tape measure protein
MKTFGFGAKFAFDTIGLSNISGASSMIANLGSQIDSVIESNQNLVGSLGMIGVGAVGLGAVKGVVEFGKSAYASAEDLESEVTILRGKLQSLSETDFENLIRDLRQVGIITQFSDAEVIKAADTLRALGAGEADLLRLTKATLGFATAGNVIPDVAAKVLLGSVNAFGGGAEMADKYADAMLNARNTTAIASSELGLYEYAHFFKNLGKFSSTMPIAIGELNAFAAAGRGAMMSAEQTGQYIGMLGQGFSQMEFKEADVLEKLGVTMRDASGKRLGFNQIFEQIYAGYEDIKNRLGHKAADELLDKLLPKQAVGAFNIFAAEVSKLGGLEGWRKNIRGLSPELNEGLMQKQWDRYLKTSKGKMEVIKGAWESVKTSIGLPLLEAAQPVLDAIGGTIGKIAEFMGDPKNAVLVNAITSIAMALTGVLAVGSVLSIIVGTVGLVVAAMPVLTSGFAVVSGALSAALPIFAGVAAVGLLVWYYWDDIKNLFMAVANWVKTNSKYFLAFGRLLLAVVTPVVKTLWSVLVEIVTWMGSLVRTVGEAIWQFVEWANQTTVGSVILKGLAVLIGAVVTPAIIRLGLMAAGSALKAVWGFASMGVSAVAASVKITASLIASMVTFVIESGKAVISAGASALSFLGVGTSATTGSAGVWTMNGALGTTLTVLEAIALIVGGVIAFFSILEKQDEYFNRGTTGNAYWDGFLALMDEIEVYFYWFFDIIMGIEDGWRWLTKSVVSAWNWVGKAFGDIGRFFTRTWNSITGGIASAWNWVVDGVVSAWNGVANFFSSLYESIANIFTNIGSAIKNAFWDAIDWIQTKWYDFLNWFVDKYNWIARKAGMQEWERFGSGGIEKTPLAPQTSPIPAVRPTSSLSGIQGLQASRNVTQPTVVAQQREFNFNASINVSGDVNQNQINAIKKQLRSDVYDSLRLASEVT